MTAFGSGSNVVKLSFTGRDVPEMDSEGTDSGSKGVDVFICSEEEQKLSWMQDNRTTLLMHMELEMC